MSQKMATRDAYGKALAKLGETNKDIVVLDADLSGSTKTANFRELYPDRFFNMGIAEQNLMGTAAGLAAAGKIPFASTFAVFATGRAFEIIRNSICYPKLNVKVAATHAGLTVGEDGATHQSIEDLAIMRSLPNMVVLCPSDGIEAMAAVNAAAEYKGPVYIRLGRPGLPIVFDEEYTFEIGKAIQMTEGTDVTLVATGIMLFEALKAKDILAEEGISARVINMPTIKPLDAEAILKAAEETGAIVTAEEHSIIGGLGSAVAEVIIENTLVPVQRVGVMDTFGESGTPDALLEKYGLTAQNIVAKAKAVIERKTK
ncbi:transketolase family protein [Irregularibacter muris]|uniref:Transketolase family protein n=1 Tax=Irregularibacter muris TaxID=1796619 RepID=A0AAE3HGM7_9FIRM|nr:transketolase family protein [Irregularibacter muris]MCR1899079.1 transketolase family protein [Irregularibacter muris]